MNHGKRPMRCFGGPLDGQVIEHDPYTGDQVRVAVGGGFTTYRVELVARPKEPQQFWQLTHHDSPPPAYDPEKDPRFQPGEEA